MSDGFKSGDTLSFLNNQRKVADKKSALQRTENFAEIYQNNNSLDLQRQADRCLDCGNPYCEWKCPLHNYIPNWLQLVSSGDYEKAAIIMHQTNPLPEICGRVCPQDRLCEQACTLNTGFGAVTIGAIEKSIADLALENNWRPDLSLVKPTGKCVAVVGAGPAGLACAELLVRNGVQAVVYDRYPEIGGLLTFGIPNFKLEKEILLKRRQFLEDIGVKFQLNTEIGKDITIDELQSDYDSVFLGMGTYNAVDGNLIEKHTQGVVQSLDYLIGNINQQQSYAMQNSQYHDLKNKTVIVLGGGDTAMDCVRSAIRQQARSVTCVYRKDQAAMPGSTTEVQNAKEEGVKFIFHLQPTEITSENNIVKGINFTRTDYNQLKYKNKQIFLQADCVILAFGFRASPADWFKPAGIKTEDSGLVSTKSYSQSTTHKGLYAGGDMVSGADLVVTAIAQGRDAAKEIMADLGVMDY
ncbi:MAG: FAD-dependent oxidoreductase [Alcanivoracaceae bacterium]|nr:FAD-dependent oxidoreductase [Alcanivoracaceae bacterium]